MKRCDAKDGIADGMISDPLACDFDPEALACKKGQSDSCLADKAAAIKKAIDGPKTTSGIQVYPAYLYDAGITSAPRVQDYLCRAQASSGPRRLPWKSMSIRKR